MQLLARCKKGFNVLASEAKKRSDYACLECGATVRLRHGPHRQPHFFHLSPPLSCRQHEKSWAHLQLQLFILKLLPPGEGAIEKAYPAIGRIADVSWEREKIVFEIQCSSISLEEARARCEAYQSLHLLPVWILYQRRFNKNFLSAAEEYLRGGLSFFARFNQRGGWLIYDQFEVCRQSRRLFSSEPLPVLLSRPLQAAGNRTFYGSLAHRFCLDPGLKEYFNKRKQHLIKKRRPSSLWKSIRTLCNAFLQLLLEALAKK
ncbi:MAG: hypothetical protein A3G30_05380 [Chlamydiae bacterium RIFCSPLOWO2_12_FULL_49_12]|nr:MAG: hypothetical protein A3G30_05380 [Chlamydiae bacterium RIFCSPLOWO2_12_FULL_49_12]HCJ83478.1 hypothetical protein [Parachlamydiales bacterium]